MSHRGRAVAAVATAFVLAGVPGSTAAEEGVPVVQFETIDVTEPGVDPAEGASCE